MNLPASHFLNRELGLIAFNRRVLAQAQDERVPLLERLFFLCIVSSNLDEFFEIRMAGLKEQIKGHSKTRTTDGLLPQEAYDQVSAAVHRLVADQYRELNNTLLPAAASEGIRFYPQISPRTVDLRINWASSMMFMSMPQGWHRVIAAPAADKAALLADESWRAVARDEMSLLAKQSKDSSLEMLARILQEATNEDN